MREQNNTQYRPEQLRYLAYLKDELTCNFELEYEVPNLKTVDCIEPKTVIADIADLTCKMIYRINGPIHEGRIQILKDEDQKIVLKGNGWHVMDIWYDEYTALWDGKGLWRGETLILEQQIFDRQMGNFRHVTKKSE